MKNTLKKTMFKENEKSGNISLTFKEFDSVLAGDVENVDIYKSTGFVKTMSNKEILNNIVGVRDSYYLVKY